MALIAAAHGAEAFGHTPRPLMTLGVAILFAGIYVFGGRASQVLGEVALRRFHSFAAGIAVSYVFIYIMPEIHEIREAHARVEVDYIRRIFPQYSVYLAALVGFLIFYGLENTMARTPGDAGHRAGHHGAVNPRQAWIHISGFAIYTWLITFQLGGAEKGLVALCVFGLAMGLHIAPITNRLRSDYRSVYEHRGALVLALASIVGWACGCTLSLPGPLVLDMAAVVAGGVIVNAAIAELPKGREASFGSFLVGAAAYSALLLTLSHFDNGVHP